MVKLPLKASLSLNILVIDDISYNFNGYFGVLIEDI